MSQGFSRLLAIVMLAVSAGAMLTVSFDAEARRMGGGRSFGKQSSNVTQQRQATTPPAASTTQRSAAPAAAGAATAAQAGARTGMSRFLGPIAGIAAGLGIAALLSSMGLSGAFLEMMSSLLLIALLVFAVMFIVRRFRAGSNNGPVLQKTANPGSARSYEQSRPAPEAPAHNAWRQGSGPLTSTGAAPAVVPAAPVDEKWFVPADFDTPAFLAQAKTQFIEIQRVWDSGNVDQLQEYLTDDLVAEIKPQLLENAGAGQTEVVLLNAELLGIEKVSDGYLASVRYSGMLRESKDAEAFRFEEVWNLYKADGAGWLLAGIQQIPVEYAS
jgi:predicted lipid-binding transport protein (Tim44 family)